MMFCPNCGVETIEGHRFCKNCGTNIEAVAGALTGNTDFMGQLGVDVEALKRSVSEIGKKIKADLGGMAGGWEKWSESHTKPLSRRTTKRRREPRRPSPKEWLGYSSQHNIRDGLISLFGGAGLGILLYFLGRESIESGTIADLSARWDVQGLTRLVSLVWLVSTVPVLKGIAQMMYGVFFAESIAVLSERFAPPPPLPEPQDTSSPAYQITGEPLASVTEQTTEIFDKSPVPERPQVGVES